MATQGPVTTNTDGSWTLVKSGVFSGGIQNVGNAPLVAVVVLTAGGAPEAGIGGFSVLGTIAQIALLSKETLYVRSIGGAGAVVLV